MLAGAIWAGIAGLLRVYRGVSEVISTIMLNAIAALLVGYLVKQWGISSGSDHRDQADPEGQLGRRHLALRGRCRRSSSGWHCWPPVLGIAYCVVLNRTRFGFNLRATGSSETPLSLPAST